MCERGKVNDGAKGREAQVHSCSSNTRTKWFNVECDVVAVLP